MRYLLDTNIISEPFKLDPEPSVIAKLQAHSHEMAIAAVTWHELNYGFHRMPSSRRKQQLETYLNQTIGSTLPILPYDKRAAAWFARERARLMGLGQPPSLPDGQIAAIAQVNSLILVTRNISDFQNFADLMLENWFSLQ